MKIGNLVVKNPVPAHIGRIPHSQSLSQIVDNTRAGGYLTSSHSAKSLKKTTYNQAGMIRRHNDIIEESQEDLNDDELDQSPMKDDAEGISPIEQKLYINSLDEENLSVGLGVNRLSGNTRNANRIIGRGQPQPRVIPHMF